MSDSAAASRGWLYGPGRDLLLGCGLLYAVFFVASAVAGDAIRTGQPPLLLPLVALAFATPHYGATLLRVYEQRSDRRAYAYFAVWITLALCVLFVAGVYSSLVASVLLTVYLSWSPWHYTGQNYGIGVMFLRRRGVPLSDATKRWVYASFTLSFVLTAVVMHTGTGSVTDTLVGYSGEGVRFLALGIPVPVARGLLVVLLLAYTASSAVALAQLLRVASIRQIGPLLALMGTQALWFSVPLGLRGLGFESRIEPLAGDLRTHYFLWIAAGHAVQYLWVTSYYARSSATWNGLARWYGKVLLLGNAAWTIPVVLFAPDGIGRLSYDGGLALLVASLVNLHHFVLDGAIWKLRDSRIASVLIRSDEASERPAPIDASGRARGVPAAAWAVLAVVLAVTAVEFWERRVNRPSAMLRRAYDDVSRSLDRMRWIGRDSAHTRVFVANGYLGAGDHAAAAREFMRGQELRPNSRSLDGLGQIMAMQGRYAEALELFEAALEVSPDSPGIMAHAARTLLALGEPERARAMLARAESIDPDSLVVRRVLEQERRLSDERAPAVY